MKKALFLLILSGMVGVNSWAIPTDEIAALRQRTEGVEASLSDSDHAIVDRFWRISLDAMLLSEESAQVVSIRRQIEQQKGAHPDGGYAETYFDVGRRHLTTAFTTVANWQDSPRKTLMERNLMILTAQLRGLPLVELGLDRLDDPDDIVRYWAVRAVTDTAIAQQLSSTEAGVADLAAKLFEALSDRAVQEPDLEILRNVVRFAAMFNRNEARQILLTLADRRIQAYMDWDVENEQFDVVLLKVMGQIVLADRESEARASMARRFAELLSMVFQRYLYEPSPLTEARRNALLTVIAEVDSQVLTRIMEGQTGIVRALQRRSGLDREYETLFGSELRPGELATRLGFNFGRTADGRVINAPPKLPAPTQP